MTSVDAARLHLEQADAHLVAALVRMTTFSRRMDDLDGTGPASAEGVRLLGLMIESYKLMRRYRDQASAAYETAKLLDRL